jgi:DNA-binding IclR family transcriptional regulator
VLVNVPPPLPIPAWKELLPFLREVRDHGLSRSDGETLPGVNAMAVPVFDHGGDIAAAITAIGPAGVFDLAWDGQIARELKACAQRVARRLGATPEDKKP